MIKRLSKKSKGHKNTNLKESDSSEEIQALHEETQNIHQEIKTLNQEIYNNSESPWNLHQEVGNIQLEILKIKDHLKEFKVLIPNIIQLIDSYDQTQKFNYVWVKLFIQTQLEICPDEKILTAQLNPTLIKYIQQFGYNIQIHEIPIYIQNILDQDFNLDKNYYGLKFK